MELIEGWVKRLCLDKNYQEESNDLVVIDGLDGCKLVLYRPCIDAILYWKWDGAYERDGQVVELAGLWKREGCVTHKDLYINEDRVDLWSRSQPSHSQGNRLLPRISVA